MNDLLSSKILTRLKREAAETGRPEQRLATLNRLVEACDAITDGSALVVVQKGNPSAAINFRKRWIAISPPRIEEYVVARRALDRKSGDRSPWTGPAASTLRKEGLGMLAYVRAREQERSAIKATKTAESRLPWWHLLDAVTDEKTRIRLMRELSEGSEAKKSVAILKRAVNLCSSSFDIDAYLRGDLDGPVQGASGILESDAVPSTPPRLKRSTEVIQHLIAKLKNNSRLAAFDLECDGKRVRQRTTKDTLISAAELIAIEELLRHLNESAAEQLGRAS